MKKPENTLARLLATIGLLFIAIALPVLEISPTHVFNESWPPHARFHEVWQLWTNTGIAILGLWLIWWRGRTCLAAVLGMFMIGGALAALVLSPLYGGAVTYEGGPEAQVLGLHAAVAIPIFVFLLFVLACLFRR